MNSVGGWTGFGLFFIAAIALAVAFPQMGGAAGLAIGIILPWIGYAVGSVLDRR